MKVDNDDMPFLPEEMLPELQKICEKSQWMEVSFHPILFSQ
jgi:hypothetical protein